MKRCVECDRRGLLLRLDADGRCEPCAVRLGQELEHRVNQIRGLLAAVDAEADVDGVVAELGRIERLCRDLEELEQARRGRASPRTQLLLRTVDERRDRVLTAWADTVTEAAVRQAARLGSRPEREELLHQALSRLQGYRGLLVDAVEYQERQRQLGALLTQLRAEPPAAAGAVTAGEEPPLRLVARPDSVGETAATAVEEAPAPAGSPGDRRRMPRRRRRFSVTVSPGGDRCEAEDLSASGILLRSAREQHVGDFLDLRLHTPKGRYHATGIVVWTCSGGRERALPNSLGVAFTGGVPVAAA